MDVLNQTGTKVEEVSLNKDVFGVEVNNGVIYDAVQVYMSNSRQATAKTKKRDEVSGGGRKPWRQKGTGRARQGSTRSPQWRGGGVVFGPTGEQNFKLKQNRKEARLALKSVLSDKVNTKDLIEKTIQEIDKGNKITVSTAEAFEKIIQDMRSFADLTNVLTESADGQAHSLVQIQQGVEQISAVTQENAAASEESSAISEQLAGKAAELDVLVKRFKLFE